MKVKSFVTALLLVFTMFSCSKYDDSEIWDYVKGMNTRLTALEEKCKDMNTNITSLQTIVAAFENGDYITNVAPVMRNGIQIGYTISFLKSPAITIYNGNDGKDGKDGNNGLDGKDGNDGYTPVIGVKKDADGLYYWTVDGEWLLDGDGMKVRASGIDGKDGTNGTNGTNGTDGTDGTDGTNGENGITPLLKIENEYWYVSYDAGTSWQILGKATGDKGADGTSLFQSVEVTSTEVTFVLTDGTSFSIPLNYSNLTGHEVVDLGLPSGTLWATCNIGANSPEEYGDYFAWGETQPKETYNWDTYRYSGSAYNTINKYRQTDHKTELEPEDDAARVNWGEGWQMPSFQQLNELINSSYTTTTITLLNGIKGMLITSKRNGRSIFLPSAGNYVTRNNPEHAWGYYWSRSVDMGTNIWASAYRLVFHQEGSIYTDGNGRYDGLPVRPVR